MKIALDGTMRSYDKNGHLLVEKTVITKADVNQYKGREIHKYEELGLDPDKTYNLLRDPDELKKSLKSFDGVQLLIKHIPVNSDEPHNNLTIGSIIPEIKMDKDLVYAALRVFDQKGIDLIETGELQELSAGYSYRADMTKGEYNGVPYDGVMRDIHGNHVAIVKRGRIGPDSVIADELPKTLENEMKLKQGAFKAIADAIKKGLAMDEEVKDDVVKKVVEVVKDSMNDEDTKAKDNDPEKSAEDEGEDDKDAKYDDRLEKDKKKLNDKESEIDDYKEKAKGAEDSKPAMDADTIRSQAVKEVTALFRAREKVKPLVGLIACDSAEEVYAEALRAKNVPIKGVHVSAYEPMVDMLLQSNKTKPAIAQDSVSFESDPFTDRFK